MAHLFWLCSELLGSVHTLQSAFSGEFDFQKFCASAKIKRSTLGRRKVKEVI